MNDDIVRFQLQPQGKWQPGKIVQHDNINPKSFVVQTPEGQEYRRNRRHLMKTEEKFEEQSHSDENEIPDIPNDNVNINKPIDKSCTTRSGRIVKRPVRFIEEY